MNGLKNSFRRLKAVRGWILDLYPSGLSEVTVWIISEGGERVRLSDRYKRRIYVSGTPSNLEGLAKNIMGSKSVAGFRFVEKYADFMEAARKTVLEIEMRDYKRTKFFARKVMRLGGYERFQLYNVDVPVTQAYLYDRDVYPLSHVLAFENGDGVYYEVLDSVESCEYNLPPLRSAWIHVDLKREGAPLRFTDKIERITLDFGDEKVILDGGGEGEKILQLVKAVREKDPDIVFTRGGDSFLLPYLAYRAFANGVLDQLVLGRENIPLKVFKSRGRSFFSYGRVYYKAPLRRLFGRIHIDVGNTFIYADCGLEGLIEVSRTCRVPLHRASRASIGSIMTSLQFYNAWKDEVLIPWKKSEPESFKTGWDLLVADRGGFIFEPKIGFHTEVFEVDFTSMFPVLMQTRNISAETVLCSCCPNSKLRVPELGYHICEKRRGIVPKTLDMLLMKRLRYKELMRQTADERLRRIYDLRQAALKWILVTCFGYLGYRNARFGKVDAHIAVCAFAREILLRTARLAEEHGFEVVHGIVDSLWIKKPGASPKEVAEFCREASALTGVPLNVEGKYRWIVFLPSKIFPQIPVLNRYYGVLDDGRVKMRGVEARRADTPPYIAKAQREMIKVLASASNFEEFSSRIPEALRVLRGYCERLLNGKLSINDLLIKKRISKSPEEYSHDVFQALAAKQLKDAGFNVYPGQAVQYLIADADNRSPNRRVKAAQLLNANSKFDVKKYLELLLEAGETLLKVFGYNMDKIRSQALYGEKQQLLN